MDRWRERRSDTSFRCNGINVCDSFWQVLGKRGSETRRREEERRERRRRRRNRKKTRRKRAMEEF